MGSVVRRMRRRKRCLGEVRVLRREEYQRLELSAKVELTRSLIPLGLMNVQMLLDEEVDALAASRATTSTTRKSWLTARGASSSRGRIGATMPRWTEFLRSACDQTGISVGRSLCRADDYLRRACTGFCVSR